MNNVSRRSFLGGSAKATVAGAVAMVGLMPSVNNAQASDQPIKGVGVVRFPNGGSPEQRRKCREVAQKMCESIRQGSMIALPNMRDEHGNYSWDFRIEGGDIDQVRVERAEEPRATKNDMVVIDKDNLAAFTGPDAKELAVEYAAWLRWKEETAKSVGQTGAIVAPTS